MRLAIYAHTMASKVLGWGLVVLVAAGFTATSGSAFAQGRTVRAKQVVRGKTGKLANASVRPNKVNNKLSSALKYMKNDYRLWQAERTRTGKVIGRFTARPALAFSEALHIAKTQSLSPRHKRAAARTLAKSYSDVLKDVRNTGIVTFVRSEIRRSGGLMTPQDRAVLKEMLKEALPPMQRVLRGKVGGAELEPAMLKTLQADPRVKRALRGTVGHIGEIRALIRVVDGKAPVTPLRLDDALPES